MINSRKVKLHFLNQDLKELDKRQLESGIINHYHARKIEKSIKYSIVIWDLSFLPFFFSSFKFEQHRLRELSLKIELLNKGYDKNLYLK